MVMRVAAQIVAVLLTSSASAQATRPPTHEADQLSMSVDVLWNVRAAVTKFALEHRVKLYHVAALRLIDCAMLYSVISGQKRTDTETSAALKGASTVYIRAGAFLFTGPKEQFEALADGSLARVKKFTDNKPMADAFLQGCKDLSQSEAEAYRVISRWAINLK